MTMEIFKRFIFIVQTWSYRCPGSKKFTYFFHLLLYFLNLYNLIFQFISVYDVFQYTTLYLTVFHGFHSLLHNLILIFYIFTKYIYFFNIFYCFTFTRVRKKKFIHKYFLFRCRYHSFRQEKVIYSKLYLLQCFKCNIYYISVIYI